MFLLVTVSVLSNTTLIQIFSCFIRYFQWCK